MRVRLMHPDRAADLGPAPPDTADLARDLPLLATGTYK